MSDESSNQELPKRLSRLERALIEQGLYVPPKLKLEIEDALKATAVEVGYKESRGLDLFEIKFSREEKGGKPIFVMNIFGYSNKPGPFLKFVTYLKDYIRKNGLEKIVTFEQADESRTIMRSNDFGQMVSVLLKGFIEEVSPRNAVDYDEIMSAPKSWIKMENDRRQDGDGKGRGGPGGS